MVRSKTLPGRQAAVLQAADQEAKIKRKMKLSTLLNLEGTCCPKCGRCTVGWLNKLIHLLLCGRRP